MNKTLSQLADDLGFLKAKIAELTSQEKALKEKLIASKCTGVNGDVFRVTISTSERESLDMKAVREKLSPQFIAAHTSVTEVTTVKVVARVRDQTEAIAA